MALICPKCGQVALGNAEQNLSYMVCSACGEHVPTNILPLFVVTGASGAGKSAVLPLLRRLLPQVDIFDKDLLWGRCGDEFYNNWLRIAYSIAQGGRYSLIAGIIMPADFDNCPDRDLVGKIYYFNLHCSDVQRERRLRARPAWRHCSDNGFIDEHKQVATRLVTLARTLDPPMPTIDTSDLPVERVAQELAWLVSSIIHIYPTRLPSLTAATG